MAVLIHHKTWRNKGSQIILSRSITGSNFDEQHFLNLFTKKNKKYSNWDVDGEKIRPIVSSIAC